MKMTELETLQAELAAGKNRIKEIEEQIASIEVTDRLEAKPIKAWVATDKDGLLFIFEDKPERDEEGFWYIKSDFRFEYIDKKYLPFQAPAWGDEPIQVEITIKKA